MKHFLLSLALVLTGLSSGVAQESWNLQRCVDEALRNNLLVRQARLKHPQVATGRFGAKMQVHLVNDGPVTFLLES